MSSISIGNNRQWYDIVQDGNGGESNRIQGSILPFVSVNTSIDGNSRVVLSVFYYDTFSKCIRRSFDRSPDMEFQNISNLSSLSGVTNVIGYTDQTNYSNNNYYYTDNSNIYSSGSSLPLINFSSNPTNVKIKKYISSTNNYFVFSVSSNIYSITGGNTITYTQLVNDYDGRDFYPYIDNSTQTRYLAYTNNSSLKVLTPNSSSSVTTYGTIVYTSAKLGNSAVFNNTIGIAATNYILVGITQTNPISISIWFNTTNGTALQSVFSLVNTSLTPILDVGFHNPNASNGLVLNITGSSGYVNIISTGTQVAANTWYHLCVTIDPSYYTILYVNGVNVGAIMSSSLLNVAYIMMGGNGSGTGSFTGYIDELNVFNRAISSGEVTTLYGLGNISSGLIAHYAFDTPISNLYPITVTNTDGFLNLKSNNIFVGVGNQSSGTGQIAYSNNGNIWNISTNGSSLFSQVFCVASNGSLWIAGGTGTNKMAYSYDGNNWIPITSGNSIFSDGGVQSIAYYNNQWIAGGYGTNRIAYSSDGINWTISTSSNSFSTTNCRGFTYYNNNWYAISDPSKLLVSSNGNVWTLSNDLSSYISQTIFAISSDNSKIVIGGQGTNTLIYSNANVSNIFVSTSGSNLFETCNAIKWNGNLFVSCGAGNQSNTTIAYSSDGISWTAAANNLFGFGHTGKSIAWNESVWTAGSDGSNLVAYSNDAINWTASTSGNQIFSVCNGMASGNSYITNIPVTSSAKNNSGIFNNSIGGLANNYITASNKINLPISTAFWFYPLDTANLQTIVSLGNEENNNNSIEFNLQSNTLVMNVENSNIISNVSIIPNSWYSVFASVANANINLYVNNQLDSGIFNPNILSYTDQFTIGCNNNGLINGFSGYLDEFYVFNNFNPINPNIFNSNITIADNTGQTIYIPFDVPIEVTNTSNINYTVTGSIPVSSAIVGNSAFFNNVVNFYGNISPTIYNVIPFTQPPPFTISFWFNCTNVYLYNSVFSLGNNSYILNYDIGSNVIGLNGIGGSPIPISSNIWYHTVLTIDSLYNFQIYFNNELLQSGSNITNITGYSQFILGSSGALERGYNGYLDEFIVYNRVISAEEVSSLYNIRGSISTSISNSLSAVSNGAIIYMPLDGNTKTSEFCVACGNDQTRSPLKYSYDGKNWYDCNSVFNNNFAFGVAYNGEMWVAVGQGTNNTIAYSLDGIYWIGCGLIFNLNGLSIACNQNRMWIAGGYGVVGGTVLAYSYNGIIWTPIINKLFDRAQIRTIAWNGNYWLAGGISNIGLAIMIMSFDGINWSNINISSIFTTAINSICWNGSIWNAGGIGSTSLAYSSDGINWYPSANNLINTEIRSITWNGIIWCASGERSDNDIFIIKSDDGVSWTNTEYNGGTIRWPDSLTWNSSKFIGLTDTGYITYSIDGQAWTNVEVNPLFSNVGIAIVSSIALPIINPRSPNTLNITNGTTVGNVIYSGVNGGSGLFIYPSPTSNLTNYITISNQQQNPITISIWFNLSDTTTISTILSFTDVALVANAQSNISIVHDLQNKYVTFSASFSSIISITSLGNSVLPNTWNHAAITIDNSNVVICYLNGNRIGSDTGSGTLIKSSFIILGGLYGYNGYISEFMVYNYVLNDSQIFDLYKLKTNLNGRIIYLPLNEPISNTPIIPTTAATTIGTITYTTALNRNSGYFNNTIGSSNIPPTIYMLVPYTKSVPISISFWFNFTNLASGTVGSILALTNASLGSAGGYIINFDISTSNIRCNINTIGNLSVNSYPILSNTWYHVCLTIDASNNQKFYINSNLIGSGIGTGTLNNYTQFIIGGSGDLLRALNGYIDDFVVYNRILSPIEIGNLYNLKNVTNGQIVWLPFDAPIIAEIIPTVVGSVNYTTSVKGNSGYFNNTIGSGVAPLNYLIIPYTNPFPITISFWINCSNVTTVQSPVGLTDNSNSYILNFDIASGNISMSIVTGGLTGTLTPIEVNKWYHICATIDSLNNQYFYVDGSLIGSSVGSLPIPNYTKFRIGGNGQNTKAFNGYVDEFIVYNRVLTIGEVTLLANSKNITDSVVVYAPLDKDNYQWTPIQIEDCQLWLDSADPLATGTAPANGTTISSWKDKSGNGLNGTAAGTGSATLVNSVNGIVFNGTAYYDTPYISNPVRETVFIVLQFNNLTGQQDIIGTNIIETRDLYMYGGVVNLASLQTGTNIFVGTKSISNNTRILYDYTYDNTNATSYFNGSQDATANNSNFSGTGTTQIGATLDIATFNGIISEIIIYNKILSVEQRQSVEGYLAKKWGLQSSLQKNHPYYLASMVTATGNPWLPTNLPSLELWLDGADPLGTGNSVVSGTVINTWYDKSGNGYNVTGAGGPTMNTKNAITFNGTNQYYNTNFPTTGTNQSIFIVYSINTLGFYGLIDTDTFGGRAVDLRVTNINLYNPNNIYSPGELVSANNNFYQLRSSVVAGNSTLAVVDGIGTGASFYSPGAITVDNNNNIYVCDTYAQVIRKITSASVVTTIAGTLDTAGFTNGTGLAATFTNPNSIGVSNVTGNIFVSDHGSLRTVRLITPAGVVTTLISVSDPQDIWGFAIDANENVFYLNIFGGNGGNTKLCKLVYNGNNSWTDSVVIDFGQLSYSKGICMGLDNNLYIADTNNGRVVRVDQTTFALTTIYTGVNYNVIAVDSLGNLYAPGNLTQSGISNSQIIKNKTILVTGDPQGGGGYRDSNLPYLVFNNAISIFIGTDNTVYFNDNSRVRKFTINNTDPMVNLGFDFINHTNLQQNNIPALTVYNQFNQNSYIIATVDYPSLSYNVSHLSEVIISEYGGTSIFMNGNRNLINDIGSFSYAGNTLIGSGLVNGSITNFLNGTISEIILCNSILNDNDRLYVEGYLAKKWQLKSSLPISNPFKFIDPIYVPNVTNATNMFVAGGSNIEGSYQTLAYSNDGITWSPISFGDKPNSVYSIIAYGNGLWLAGGNFLIYSNDGINWSVSGIPSGTIYGIVWVAHSKYWLATVSVINGSYPIYYYYSSDGLKWKFFSGGNINKLYYVNNTIYGISDGSGNNSTLYSSIDGRTWTTTGLNYISTIAYNGSQYLAGCSSADSEYPIYYSTDGINWTGSTSSQTVFEGMYVAQYGPNIIINQFAWNGTTWVAASQSTTVVAYSSDGITWTGADCEQYNNTFTGVAWNGTNFVAVSTKAIIGGSVNATNVLYSSDGITWTVSTSGSAILYDRVACVAVGNSITSYSPNIPKQIPGLFNWIDTSDTNTLYTDEAGSIPVLNSGDSVQCIIDKSTGIRVSSVETGPTFNSKLLNLKPGIDFSNSSGLMSAPLVKSSNVTLLWVGTVSSNIPQFAPLWGHYSTIGLSVNTDILLRRNLNGQMSWFTDNNSNVAINLNPNQPVIYYATMENGINMNLTMITNSATYTNISKTVTLSLTDGLAPIFIGADSFYNYSLSYMSEILYYQRVLEQSEINTILSYLDTKWDINTIVPTYPIENIVNTWTPNEENKLSLWLDAGDYSTSNITNSTQVSVLRDKVNGIAFSPQGTYQSNLTLITGNINTLPSMYFNNRNRDNVYMTGTYNFNNSGSLLFVANLLPTTNTKEAIISWNDQLSIGFENNNNNISVYGYNLSFSTNNGYNSNGSSYVNQFSGVNGIILLVGNSTPPENGSIVTGPFIIGSSTVISGSTVSSPNPYVAAYQITISANLTNEGVGVIGNIYKYYFTSPNATYISANSNITINTPTIIYSDWSNGNVSISVNGNNLITGNINLPSGLQSTLTISKDSNSYPMIFGELLIYSEIISTSARQKAEGYLANKWGLQSSLPNTHPFANVVPTITNIIYPTVVNDPKSFNGLLLWLDGADPYGTNSSSIPTLGTLINKWYDKSGNNNHFIQNVVSQVPIYNYDSSYNKNGLTFNSNQYYIQEGNPLFNGLNKYTIFTVHKFTNSGAVYSTNTGNKKISLINTGNLIRFSFGGYNQNDSSSSSNYSDSSGISCLKSDSTANGYINGKKIVSSVYRGLSTFPDYSFIIGNDIIENPFYTFVGTIFEVLVFNYAMNDTEREVIESYLANKWGLGQKLPIDHQYFMTNNSNISKTGNVIYSGGYEGEGGGGGNSTIITNTNSLFSSNYITIPNTTNIPLSINLWMNCNNVIPYQSVIGLSNASFDTSGLNIDIVGGKLLANICLANLSFPNISTTISSNKWYNIGLNIDNNYNGTLYLNGLNIGSAWGGNSNIGIVNYTQFILGGPSDNSSRSYSGYLQNFKVYNRMLVDYEMKNIYNNGYISDGLIINQSLGANVNISNISIVGNVLISGVSGGSALFVNTPGDGMVPTNYITIPNDKNIRIPVTFSCWFNSVDGINYQSILSFTEQTFLNSILSLVIDYNPTNKNIIFLAAIPTQWSQVLSPNNSAFPNTWNHIAITIDTSFNFICYLNGIKVGSITGTATIKPYTLFLLGGAGLYRGFNGYIENFLVYNRVLSGSEISSLYNLKSITYGLTVNLPLTSDPSSITNDSSTSTIIGNIESVPGIYGKCAFFNNTLGAISSQYITVPNLQNLPITFSFWLNYSSLSTNVQNPFSIGGTGFINIGNSGSIRCDLSDGTIRIFISAEDTTFITYAVSANTWYHICVTIDSTYTGILYVNGVNVGANKSSRTSIANYTQINIATSPDNNPFAYNGYIDEVKIYNRALLSNEVLSLYQSNNISYGLITYLPLDITSTIITQTGIIPNINPPLKQYKGVWSYVTNYIAFDTVLLNNYYYMLASTGGWSIGGAPPGFGWSLLTNISGSTIFNNPASSPAANTIITSYNIGGAISVAFWFYAFNVQNEQTIVQLTDDSNTLILNFNISNGLIEILAGESLSSMQQPILVNTWYHVCFVPNNNGGGAHYYINGTQNSALGSFDVTPYTKFRLGGSNTKGFAGYLQNFVVYNTLKNASDIDQLYNYNIPTSGLQIHLPLNQSSYGVLNTSNETIYGNPTYSTGQIGNAVNFTDGTSYITVPNTTNVPMSISFWFKDTGFENAGAQGNVLFSGDTYSDGFLIYLDGTFFTLWIGDETDWNVILNVSYVSGAWNHAVITIDSLFNLILYINGANVGTGNTVQNLLYLTKFSFGSANTYEAYGSIDDFQVYNRTLRSFEVNNIYNVGLGGKSLTLNGLVTYLPFENGPGVQLNVGNVLYSGVNGGSAFFNNPTSGEATDYLTIANSTNVPVSVAFWFCANRNTSTPTEFILLSGNNSTGGIIISLFENGTLRIKYALPNLLSMNGPMIDFYTWNHICVTIDSSFDVYVYVNGNLYGNDDTGTAPLTNFNTIYLGGDTNGSIAGFNGYIEDFMVYNRALSYAEVTSLYNVETITSGRVIYLHLDNGNFDSSGGSITPNVNPYNMNVLATLTSTQHSKPRIIMYNGTLYLFVVNSLDNFIYSTVIDGDKNASILNKFKEANDYKISIISGKIVITAVNPTGRLNRMTVANNALQNYYFIKTNVNVKVFDMTNLNDEEYIFYIGTDNLMHQVWNPALFIDVKSEYLITNLLIRNNDENIMMAPTFSQAIKDYYIRSTYVNEIVVVRIGIVTIGSDNTFFYKMYPGQCLHIYDYLNHYYVKLLPNNLTYGSNVTINTGYIPGYYLTADTTNGNSSPYYYVVDSNGVPVWYRRNTSDPNYSNNPQICSLFLGMGKNRVVTNIFDVGRTRSIIDISTLNEENYKAISPDTRGLTIDWDVHEALEIKNPLNRRGNMLFGCYTSAGGFYFQEQNNNHQIVWEFWSTDLINNQTGDYFHFNSLDVHPITGDIVCSFRNCSTIACINYRTKNIDWAIDVTGEFAVAVINTGLIKFLTPTNEPTDYDGTISQHDARWHYDIAPLTYGNNMISVFDNQSATGNAARGVIYEISLSNSQAIHRASVFSPDDASSGYMGSYKIQRELNGTYSHVVDYVQQHPNLYEFSDDGTGMPTGNILLSMDFPGDLYRISKARPVDLDIIAMRKTSGMPISTLLVPDQLWNTSGATNVTVNSISSVTKTSSLVEYNAQIYSKVSYIKPFFSIKLSSLTGSVLGVFGLSENPAASIGFANVNYGWNFNLTIPNASIYELGILISTPVATITNVNSVYEINFDGTNINYLIDGVNIRSVARTSQYALYCNLCIAAPSVTLSNIYYNTYANA